MEWRTRRTTDAPCVYLYDSTSIFTTDNIIVPYFKTQKKALGLPEAQKAIWQIDVWSVHRSKTFRDWMKTYHSNIIIHFVPAGCTGVFQQCDVGIQRIMKHSLKRSCHRDIVEEVLAQVDSGQVDITVSKTVGILHDRTVSWLWDAYTTLNKPIIVKKVRLHYKVRVPNTYLAGLGIRDVQNRKLQPIARELDEL